MGGLSVAIHDFLVLRTINFSVKIHGEKNREKATNFNVIEFYSRE